MTLCSCSKPFCTRPDCQEEDAPIPAPVWERVHTAGALAALANVIAELEKRVELLEQTITKWESDS